ncbi:Xre type transcriptional regulator [Neorhizobium galegae bv. officinalis]|uniref:Xre type transcriptional regulator n=1 Tax=Neorhizobium galegae bv. officinalis TaxID=323656 RepID=A0A0T7FZ33_NEOGA|nr:helix-turn-helix transcriptional regulator [Neorhizobium galegae]CDZ40270.1 Xre type transcriptional regulator [Neorhizobium galegae bv. officinalis]
MSRVKDGPSGSAAKVSRLKTLSFQERLAVGIRRLQAERGLTNRDLADQLGVSEAYMSQVTRAMRDVKLSTLDKMQRAWNIVIEDLLRVTEDDLPRINALKADHRKKKISETAT